MEPSSDFPSGPPLTETSPYAADISEDVKSFSDDDRDESPVTETAQQNTEADRIIDQDQQITEIYYITDTLQHRSIEVALNKRSQGESITPAEKKLLDLHDLQHAKDGQYFDPDPTKDKSADFSQGQPVLIDIGSGDKRRLLRIEARRTTEQKQSYFHCRFEGDDGTNPGLDIPIDQVIKAQYQAELPTILQGLTPAEQQLFLLHAQLINEGPAVMNNNDTTDINELINKVSTEQGIITAGDITSLLDSQAATIGVDQLPQVEQARQVLARINVVTDGSQMADVLSALGLSNESLSAEVASLSKQVQDLTAQLAASPDDQALKDQLDQAQANLETVQSAQEQVAEGLDFSRYFEQVRTGQIPPEQRQALAEAMRKGDISGIIINMPELADDPTDTPEEKAAKEKKRRDLTKLGTGSITTLGIILGTMWRVVNLETKELKKSLR